MAIIETLEISNKKYYIIYSRQNERQYNETLLDEERKVMNSELKYYH